MPKLKIKNPPDLIPVASGRIFGKQRPLLDKRILVELLDALHRGLGALEGDQTRHPAVHLPLGARGGAVHFTRQRRRFGGRQHVFFYFTGTKRGFTGDESAEVNMIIWRGVQ